jgi:hypothetical protein
MQVPALGPQHVAELGRQGQAAGGRKPLGDLLDRELPQGPLVDLLGAGPQGQAQHHVGQVDGLPPGARPGLDEGHVDHQQAAVTDQQVGRLDVAVGQAGVPQLADDAEAVVDHLVVDLGLTKLGGAGEELGDQQVLGMVTPRATPTSTSAGPSAPSAIRPMAFRVTRTVTTHLPVLRQRPSGTSVYRIVTSPTAKRVTCRAGMAHPPQPSRISAPNGRGR